VVNPEKIRGKISPRISRSGPFTPARSGAARCLSLTPSPSPARPQKLLKGNRVDGTSFFHPPAPATFERRPHLPRGHGVVCRPVKSQFSPPFLRHSQCVSFKSRASGRSISFHDTPCCAPLHKFAYVVGVTVPRRTQYPGGMPDNLCVRIFNGSEIPPSFRAFKIIRGNRTSTHRACQNSSPRAISHLQQITSPAQNADPQPRRIGRAYLLDLFECRFSSRPFATVTALLCPSARYIRTKLLRRHAFLRSNSFPSLAVVCIACRRGCPSLNQSGKRCSAAAVDSPVFSRS